MSEVLEIAKEKLIAEGFNAKIEEGTDNRKGITIRGVKPGLDVLALNGLGDYPEEITVAVLNELGRNIGQCEISDYKLGTKIITMPHVGINILPHYRGRGLGSLLYRIHVIINGERGDQKIPPYSPLVPFFMKHGFIPTAEFSLFKEATTKNDIAGFDLELLLDSIARDKVPQIPQLMIEMRKNPGLAMIYYERMQSITQEAKENEILKRVFEE